MASIAQGPGQPGSEAGAAAPRKKVTRTRQSRHESFLNYAGGRWWKISLALTLALVALYIWVPIPSDHFGSSWLGYTLGTLGVLLILWLTMLGLRKRAITPGRWSLKAWTSAHVWLGIFCAFVGTIHSGFYFGWNVHTLAWVLMLIVIGSGLFGIYLYLALPRSLSRNRFDEEGAITEKQMIESLRSLDRQINEAAQPLDSQSAQIVDRSLEDDPFAGNIINRLTGKYPRCATNRALVELRAARAYRPRVSDDPIDKVDSLLSRKQAMLDRLRRHLRIKSWLQAWLYIHVPTTFALIAALSAHIVSVFFYW